jgi:hypothetical protein
MSRVLKRAKGHFTQWAGQVGTALELTRRGFLVSLTLGNTPDTDLFCGRVEGGAFRIDVKGLSSKTCFLIPDLMDKADSGSIRARFHTPDVTKSLEFYVATARELRGAVESYQPKRRRLSAGQPYSSSFASPGVACRYLAQNAGQSRDRWDKLPHPNGLL